MLGQDGSDVRLSPLHDGAQVFDIGITHSEDVANAPIVLLFTLARALWRSLLLGNRYQFVDVRLQGDLDPPVPSAPRFTLVRG